MSHSIVRLAIAAAAAAASVLAAPPSSGSEARADEENPVTAAEDAFGTSVGSESIGLYQAGSVRGFSPVAAGNVRVEGLYFDQQASFTGRLVSGSTIWVGLSSLDYPFPAPTGIVDASLRLPGSTPSAALALQANVFGAAQAEVDASLPLGEGETFRLNVGAGQYEHRFADGGDGSVTSLAVIPRWRPTEQVEIVPFWSESRTRDRDMPPVFLTRGDTLPPRISRSRYLGQDWAGIERVHSNYGLLAAAPAGSWTVRAGVFRSVADVTRGYSLQFRDVTPGGDAELAAIASPHHRYASTSGELRLSRTWRGDGHGSFQRVHLAFRGRDQARRYGGADEAELGSVHLDGEVARPAPTFRFGARTRDDASLASGGIAWQGYWQDTGRLSVSLQRAEYRKEVTPPSEPSSALASSPWLYSAAGAFRLREDLALYGSYVHGLEDSPVAPEAASNRDEAPAAIQTKQADVGLRWSAPRGLTVIAGAFRLEKPHFGMDADGLFRRLGAQRRQGLEFSVSGRPLPGLHLVAGALVMDASVSGAAAGHGDKPVGSSRFAAMANLDYRLRFHPALSLDLAANRRGSRIASLDNALVLPPTTEVDLGARYRFRLAGSEAMLRLRVQNLFDRYALEVAGNRAWTLAPSREISLRLTLRR